jgi:nitrate/nitrite sensing protein/histidine kinase/DNA gyrase B/HSP90-like ATPase
VLTIALVPCLLFLTVGATAAGYLIVDAAKTRNYYTLATDAQRAAVPLIDSLQEERRLTLRSLASFGTYRADLARQRKRTDALTGKVRTTLTELSSSAPASVRKDIAQFTTLMTGLPAQRGLVDEGSVSIIDSFDYYTQITDVFVRGTKGLAQFAPGAETAYQQMVVAPLLNAMELMRRSDALAAAYLVGNGITDADFRVYQGLVSAYHLELYGTIPQATATVQEAYGRLVSSTAWQRVSQVEDTLSRGVKDLPITEDLWRGAAADVSSGLLNLLVTQNREITAQAQDSADATLLRTIIAAALVLLLAATAIVVTVRLSRRLIARLTRLRRETLELADTRLPKLVERVQTGDDVRVDDEVALRGYGGDEIGGVAEAFNKAQLTAVSAALREAKTREGTKTVFLNIARRSQAIVHRQLTVLDDAERRQEDPEQLAILFQLDHLSTRARRNAENLIILGGGQPGRRWRNPVSLTEIVRGASTETEHFARVKVAKLPRVAVTGQAVGDVVHLLAELIDNATSYSSPETRVDVRGNVVAKGVVLEVEDQGLGIEPERAEELNEVLANPPDFGIMALSEEPRLGLFVVARLAARHDISVSLRESAYGGTRAVVLIKSELLDSAPPTDTAPQEPVEEVLPPEPAPEPAPSVEEDAAPANGSSNRAVTWLPALSSLPPIPYVPAQPGEDLFRPRRPVEDTDEVPHGTHARREEETTILPIIDPGSGSEPAGFAADQPPLPRRRRQHNLAPQLRAETDDEWADPAADSPEQARDRLAAFQRGTRRARDDD